MKAQPRQSVEPSARPRMLLLSGIVLAMLFASSAFAQPPKSGKKQPPTSGKKQPTKKQPAAKKNPTTKTPSAGPTKSPIKGLPEMDIEKPLMTKKEFEDLVKWLNGQPVPGNPAIVKLGPPVRIIRILRAGVLGANERKAIQIWARVRVDGLSLPSNWGDQDSPNKLADLRAELMRDLFSAGQSVRSNPAQMRAFRKYVFQQITDRCAKLMDNNYYVRLQAILILSNMDLMPFAQGPPRRPPEAFAPAGDVLIDEVIKKPQHVSLKIAAVNGLRRIALLSPSERELSLKMAPVLITELGNAETHEWYQRRLVAALSCIDLPDELGKPIIAQALLKAMSDGARSHRVRGEAAMAIGRAAMPSSVNSDLIAYQVVTFTRTIAQSYNADVDKYIAQVKAFQAKLRQQNKPLANWWTIERAPRMPPHWPGTSYRVYLAFRPENDEEVETFRLRRVDFDKKVGLLARFDTPTIKGAYAEVLPVVSHLLKQTNVIAPRKITENDLNRLDKWLNNTANKPKNFQLQPGLPAIGGNKTPVGAAIGPNGRTATTTAGP